jgi:hypothetical protein
MKLLIETKEGIIIFKVNHKMEQQQQILISTVCDSPKPAGSVKTAPVTFIAVGQVTPRARSPEDPGPSAVTVKFRVTVWPRA